MWKRFRQWRLRRRSITQPTRTFEALLERAAQHRGAKEQALIRPKYLPKHPSRAIERVAYAIFGGASFYGGATAIVCAINGQIPWWVAIPIAPVAFLVAWRLGSRLRASINDDYHLDSGDYTSYAALRTIFWPISETGFLFIGWLGCYGYYGITLLEAWIKEWWSERNSPPNTSLERTNTVAILPDVLLGIIDAERDALIGPQSELEQLHARSLKVIEEARTVRAHFVQRIWHAGQNSPSHLIAARERADAVVMSIESRERELNERLRHIRTFYGECRARADALREDVQDLVLFERLQNVERATEAIEDEMTAAIERVSVGILSSVDRYRALLSDAITETGVRTAVAGMDHRRGTELDFTAFDDTIARFVKRADTVLSDERQDTSDDAVRSETHTVGLLTA